MKLRGTIEGADCASCPLSVLGQPEHPVVGEGPEEPMFVILGGNPSIGDQRIGSPITGENGKVFNLALKQLGLKREQVWTTYAALCPRKGANEKQCKEAAKCCRGRLNKELEQFSNKPVLVADSIAAAELLGEPKFKITEQSGAWYRRSLDSSGERDLIITVHPAAFIRVGKDAAMQYWGLVYDLAKCAELASGEGKPLEDDIEVITTIDRTERALLEFVEYAKKYGEIALDLETVGRKVYIDEDDDSEDAEFIEHDARDPAWANIIGIGLASADAKKGISIDWACMTDRSKELLQEILDNSTIIIHNKTYDVPVLRWHGFK